MDKLTHSAAFRSAKDYSPKVEVQSETNSNSKLLNFFMKRVTSQERIVHLLLKPIGNIGRILRRCVSRSGFAFGLSLRAFQSNDSLFAFLSHGEQKLIRGRKKI